MSPSPSPSSGRVSGSRNRPKEGRLAADFCLSLFRTTYTFGKIFPVVRYLFGLTVAIAWAADPAVPRTWWSGPQVTLLGSPSRDGRWISYVDPATGALAMRSLADGAVRTVPTGSGEFAHFSVFSRDAAHIAYAWFNAQGFYELRIARVSESAAPVIAYRNEIAGFVQPCSWTPDNRNVLTLLFRRDNISQIALIPAAGGAPRVLRSLNWVYPSAWMSRPMAAGSCTTTSPPRANRSAPSFCSPPTEPSQSTQQGRTSRRRDRRFSVRLR